MGIFLKHHQLTCSQNKFGAIDGRKINSRDTLPPEAPFSGRSVLAIPSEIPSEFIHQSSNLTCPFLPARKTNYDRYASGVRGIYTVHLCFEGSVGPELCGCSWSYSVCNGVASALACEGGSVGFDAKGSPISLGLADEDVSFNVETEAEIWDGDEGGLGECRLYYPRRLDGRPDN